MIPVPESRPDDASALVARIARRDEAAFDELYQLLGPAAYGLALRVTGDTHLAQDVLQETFAHVWTQAHRFDPAVGSARAWVTMLAHRRAVDRVRREQSDRTRSTEWARASHEPAHDAVADVVDLRSEHRSVRHALGGLTGLQREALQLAYFDGLTHVQVAARLDIPVGTAKTRIRDALQALRTQLKDQR